MDILRKIDKKKIDVLFLTIPFFPTRSPPVNIGSLAGYLQNKAKIDILDLNLKSKFKFNKLHHLWGNSYGIIENNEKNNIKKVNTYLKSSLDDYFKKYKVKYVAIPYYDLNLDIITIVAKHIKKKYPKTKIIVGGPGILDNYEVFAKKLFDHIVEGDGEIAIEEICKGITKERIIKNKRVNLQNIKFIDYNLFSIDKYDDKKHLYLYTTKGCINKCSYCIDYKLAFPYRKRNITDITNEIKYYYLTYGINQFTFTDLLINGDLSFLQKLAIEIRNLNLPIQWSSYFTIRDGMDKEFFSLLKDSGCNGVHFGFETASNKILEKMNKQYTQQTEQTCLHNAHSVLPTYINLIVGYPTEDEEAFQETMSFIRRNKKNITAVAFILPFFIMKNTYVSLHKSEFNITDYKSHNDWKENNNTYETRIKKIKRIKSLLKEIDIPLLINYETNL